MWSAPIADVAATAGGTYTSAEQDMINDLKAKVNAILAALRNADRLAQD